MDPLQIITPIIVAFIGILPYIIEKGKNLTKHQKTTVIAALIVILFVGVLSIMLLPIIPFDYNIHITIIFISILFAAFLNYILAYFFSPTKSDLILLKEYNIKIKNNIYAIIKYFKEEYKYDDPGIFWGFMFSIFFVITDLSIWLRSISLYPSTLLLEDIAFITIFVILSILLNLINILKIMLPIQYYIKYINPLTNETLEGFKIDRNTIYNDGEIIDVPSTSKVIEEISMRKYLNIPNEMPHYKDKISQALETLNNIESFLYLWKFCYKFHNESNNFSKRINKKIAVWLLKRRHAKNRKVWVYVIEYLEEAKEFRNHLKDCYKKILEGDLSPEEIFDLCDRKKTQEAPKDGGV